MATNSVNFKHYYIRLCLQRLLLPICLTISIFRPSFISAIYLCFLLYLPIVPVMSRSQFKGHAGRYFNMLIVATFLISILQVCFQIVLISMPPYGYFLDNCSVIESIFRHIGLVRLDKMDAIDAIKWLFPEMITLTASFTVFILLKRLAGVNDDVLIEEGNSTRVIRITSSNDYSSNFVVTLGLYLTLLTLCLAGIVRPSVPGAIYFLTFLISATYWACCRQLSKKFVHILRFITVLLTVHIVILYTYQFQIMQSLIDKNNRFCRYFGIVPIVTYSCVVDPRVFYFLTEHWDSFAYPIFLIVLYYVMVIESRLLSVQQVSYNDGGANYNENIPLMRGISPGLRYGSNTSSVRNMGVISVENTTENDDLTENNLDKNINDEHVEPDLLENILISLYTTVQKIIQSSYIANNITMMAWSIAYHSWLAFILMLWAIVLWIFPNQRRSMMRSSPFIVCYAFFLLISQYIYCMNLTESELPSTIQGFNLAQIGFKKILVLPFIPLFIKSSFTMMFLVTMRQYMRESIDARHSSTLADMVAPLQLAMGTAMNAGAEVKGTRVMKRLAQTVQTILIKFWIWVVVMMLFISGITGDRMTGFRIVYMALFLYFILTFQLSYRIWRSVMYVFWMTVIVISVTILVLVYTYQFDNFSDYWTNYLKIPKKLQLDIGLEVFETKELFVRLLTPTFFVVITVIQMHYFHNDFLKMTEIAVPISIVENQSESSQNAMNIASIKVTNRRRISSISMDKVYSRVWSYILNSFNFGLMLLDFHMTKIVTLAVMLLCVYDVCAIHLSLIGLLMLGFSCGRFFRKMVIFFISLIVSAMILSRMIYQMEYIDHNKWNVNCQNSSMANETVFNTAAWLGFRKIDANTSLNHILLWYLTFMCLVTLRSIIFMRQMHQRIFQNEPEFRPDVMFPGINRKNADDDLLSCIKFFFNYGFYKFGIEVSLTATVMLIGFRMDLYAILYGIWLLAMFNRSRTALSKIWNFYMAFIITLIPLQYCMVIGLPPNWCIEMPWSNSMDEVVHRFQEWAFLLDPLHPPDSRKMICDFIVLLLVSRQILVFRIEYWCSSGANYAGGSNESIIHLAERPQFVNPVPDFVAYITSWLDVCKKVVLLSFMWIALAVVFLSGANRINLFSVGYLIGSFWFLWQGSDLYLKPVPLIIKSWNLLLGYNVSVIFLKCIFQIIGCILMVKTQQNTCWIIQLLGIGCKIGLRDLSLTNILFSNQDECLIEQTDIGLGWDMICFTFLIMQRRLFHSYNLFHIIEDTKAMTILASRGAELIEELRQKQIVQMSEHERRVLEKIKRKMDRIKRNQQKIQGQSFQDSANHFVVRRTSKASPVGFHTPIEEEEDISIIDDNGGGGGGDGDEDSNTICDQRIPSLTITSMRPQHVRVPSSPTSALLTVSLEAYLEPKGVSLGLMPESLVTARQVMMSRTPSPIPILQQSIIADEDSFGSSPPTYGQAVATFSSLYQTNVQDFSSSSVSHHTSIRSGDYYMFDIVDDEEDDDLELSVFSLDESIEQTYGNTHGLTIFEFIDTTLKSDMEAPLKARYESEDKTKKTDRRGSDPVLGSVQSQYFRTYSLSEDRKKRSIDKRTVDIKDCPGTSKAPDELFDDSKELLSDETSNIFQKIYKLFLFIWVFIESVLLSATNYLNRFSRNYRYVSKVLKHEKIILKEFTDFTKGSRRGSSQIWQPNYTFHALMEKAKSTMPEEKLKAIVEVSEMSSDDQPVLVRFLLAVWFVILSHSEIMCYFVIFLNQMKSASILSLPLPLMVFLWGTLTVPRPTITFWVVIIAYTEIIVLLKCLFQFDLISWNQDAGIRSPFFLPRIIGVERTPYYATYDLLLLMVVFFHRFMLKSLGLWKSKADVTLIPESYYKKNDGQEIDLMNRETAESKLTSSYVSSLRFRNKSKNSYDLISGVDSDSERKIIDVKLRKDGSKYGKGFSKQLGVKIVSRNYIMKKEFFARLLDPNSKVPTDVYAYMFLCDFINFLVIIFGFSDFGAQQSDGGVSSYLEENKVPIPFLAMLILQFMLIIIDRAIFLRKSIIAKLWFQFFIIFGVHIGMFFVLPALTERKFNANSAPQLWYLMKCFYLLLSAYQIRSGYPTRILGNFLCKGYNYINMVLYKGFMLIPFLFELRTIMDWMWTDTSMTIFDWLKMEDIFSHVYQLKCSRYVENEYPQQRGAKKSSLIKYFMGGIGLFVVIAIIWFPLVLFAFGNTVGKPNVPFMMTLRLDLGTYESLYQSTVQNSSIFRISESDFENFKEVFNKRNRDAQLFLNNYDYEDIGVIKMSKDSGSVWTISPPVQQKLINDLNITKSIRLKLTYTLSRFSSTKSVEIVTGSNDVELPISRPNETDSIRNHFIRIISQAKNGTKVPILIKNILPKFLKVTNRATISNVPQLIQHYLGDGDQIYRNMTLNLQEESFKTWWKLQESCDDPYYDNFLKKIQYSDCDSLVFYTFNDKSFPPSLSIISGGGIISLYTTLVFVASRFIRGFFSDICFKIMFEDMPNVDRILQLCLDIYLVRESLELTLEEDLFAKLVFLFRSPETMIKWSRPKEETRRIVRNGNNGNSSSTYNLTSTNSEN